MKRPVFFRLMDKYYTFMQKKVLSALEDAGVFTSGGLVKDKVINVCIAGSI